MKEQGTHQKNIPGVNRTKSFCQLGPQFLNAFSRKAAHPMRAGQDAQRAVGFIRTVEVNSDREHLL